MIREVFIGMLIIITAIAGYNIANNFMEPFMQEADANEGVPNWVIDTLWWCWNNWIYIVIGSAIIIILLASQLQQSQEWEIF